MRLGSSCFLSIGGLLLLASLATVGNEASASRCPECSQRAFAVAGVEKTATLADFAWLVGRWEGKFGPATAEQQWMAPKNGTMLGFFRLTDSDKTLVAELFSLRDTPEGIVFYFRHFTPELKPLEKEDAYRLRLTRSDASGFFFENTAVNDLKDLTLAHTGDDTFQAHSDFTDSADKPASIDVTYHRVR